MGIGYSGPQHSYRSYPSDTLLLCTPDRCFCRGGHRHGGPRWVYVERTGDGRELYRDPVEFVERWVRGASFPGGGPGMMTVGPGMMGGLGMMDGPRVVGGPGMAGMGGIGGMGGMGMPMWPPEWKDPKEWKTSDFDRLGEILGEFLQRQRGRGMRRGGPWGDDTLDWDLNQMQDWDRPMMLGQDDIGRGRAERGRRGAPPGSELDQLREQMMRYAEETKEHIKNLDDCVFGSEKEQREERYKEKQKKIFEEIIKNLNGGGYSSNIPGLGMPQGFGHAGMHPMTGMAGMNPMTMGGMNPVGPMGGGMMHGNPMMMGRGGPTGGRFDDMGNPFGRRRGPGRRRAQGRGLGFGFADEFDDDDDLGGFGPGLGRRRPRRRKVGFEDDDDDDPFGLGGGDGMYVAP